MPARRYLRDREVCMSTYTLFLETSGEGGIPSRREETELREEDEILWWRNGVTLFRRLRDGESLCYRRLRRTKLAEIGVERPGLGTTYELPLPLGTRAPDVMSVMRERYMGCIPSLLWWEWKQVNGLFRITRRRLRFRASRPT